MEPRSEATEAATLGYAVIDFAREVLDVDLLPWQEWLLVHAFELTEDGAFRFQTVIVLVARQNGKSMLGQVISLFFLFVLGARKVLGCAQDLDTAEETWAGAAEYCDPELDADDEDIRAVPELQRLTRKVYRGNGKKHIELKNRCEYKVKAASRSSGRGLSGDLVLLDELREHQSWDAWGAITKTTTARPDSLVWCMSNAGDARSVVLGDLRRSAHEALGDPDGICSDVITLSAPQIRETDEGEYEEFDAQDEAGSVGFFEWSASPDRDVFDREGWAEANPSLGYLITERKLASFLATDPEHVFRTESLCQWRKGVVDGPFPANAWNACLAADSEIDTGREIVFGIDTAHSRQLTYLAVAGWSKQLGLAQVEVVTARAGTEWVKAHFAKLAQRSPETVRVALQGRGAPCSALADELAELDGVEVVRWEGSEVSIGCARFYDAVAGAVSDDPEATHLVHRVQPMLDDAASRALTKPAGDAWFWDRARSPSDIAPLIAVNAAYWALTRPNVDRPVQSAYETGSVLFV